MKLMISSGDDPSFGLELIGLFLSFQSTGLLWAGGNENQINNLKFHSQRGSSFKNSKRGIEAQFNRRF